MNQIYTERILHNSSIRGQFEASLLVIELWIGKGYRIVIWWDGALYQGLQLCAIIFIYLLEEPWVGNK